MPTRKCLFCTIEKDTRLFNRDALACMSCVIDRNKKMLGSTYSNSMIHKEFKKGCRNCGKINPEFGCMACNKDLCSNKCTLEHKCIDN